MNVDPAFVQQIIRAKIKELQEDIVVQEFHKLWYEHGSLTWASTRFAGIPLQKCPLDLFVQQEIIFDVKPTLIIETGSWQGGSSYFYGSLLNMLGHGEVITVDINPMPVQNKHFLVNAVQGSSIDPEVVSRVKQSVDDNTGPVLVILDSDHSPEHVKQELDIYSKFVTTNSYLIVEDTNISDKPVVNSYYPVGPYPAVEAFLNENSNFIQEKLCEKYLLTMHPDGWLRRIR